MPIQGFGFPSAFFPLGLGISSRPKYTKTHSGNILEAVISGDMGLVTECLTQGCDINEAGDDELTLVSIAIRNGETEIACFLITRAQLFHDKARACPSTIDWVGLFLTIEQPLWFRRCPVEYQVLYAMLEPLAFMTTHFILNHALSQFDARVMSTFRLQTYWIYSMIRTRFFRSYILQLIKLFGRLKPTVNQERTPRLYWSTNLTSRGCQAMECMLRYGGTIEPVAVELLSAGLIFDDINETDGLAWTLWDWAADRGYRDVMMTLQAKGVDVNAKSGTTLRHACRKMDTATCIALLQSGASPILRADWEDPPIIACAKTASGRAYRDSDSISDALLIFELLLAHGESPDTTGQEGLTALHVLCRSSGTHRLVRFLLEKGAQPDVQDI